MANKSFNKVIAVVRLGRDPETRTFGNGGKVAKLNVVINNIKKNQSGKYDSDPCWIEVDCFNSQYGQKLADVASEYLRKGSQVLVEGHLVMESWDDKTTGAKRTKVKVVADSLQLLDAKGSSPSQSSQQEQPSGEMPDSGMPDASLPSADDSQIPF